MKQWQAQCRDCGGVQFVNVTDYKFSSISEMIPIHLPFVLVDVIGKYDSPTRTLKPKPHKANACEELSEVFTLDGFSLCRAFCFSKL